MKQYNFTINGNQYDVTIKSFEGSNAVVQVNGESYNVALQQEKIAPKALKPIVSKESSEKVAPKKKGTIIIKAPIPGNILEVFVATGQKLKKGDKIAILDAMKMENEILSEKEGTVIAVHIKPGDVVMQGFAMVELEIN